MSSNVPRTENATEATPTRVARCSAIAPLASITVLVGLLLGGCGLIPDAKDFGPADPGDTGLADADVTVDPTAPIGPDGAPLVGAVAGASCGGDGDCRAGLACSGGSCAPGGTSGEGEPCTVSTECASGLTCNLAATCVPSGGIEEGGACSLPSSCMRGLRCELVGFSGACVAQGDADVGQSCSESTDCLAPLACSGEGVCQIPVIGRGVERFVGAQCEEAAPGDPFRVFFDISPADEAPTEFFRLPYPNDARLTTDGIDMRGFPTPAPEELAGGIIGPLMQELGESDGGFSPNATIYFRFNKSPKFESLRVDGENPTIRFVNIDADSESFGRGVSFAWSARTGRGSRRKYICENHLLIKTPWRAPLDPETTYAVILTDGIRGEDDELPQVSPDFEAMMSNTEPVEPRLAGPWAAYEPLREYLEAEDFPTTNVLAATVFTTDESTAAVPALRDAVAAESAAPLESLTLCEDGAESPCGTGETRACVNAGGLVELHATYTAPVWQEGTRPYLTPEDGGGLSVGGDGVPRSAGQEEICVAITLPLTEMPENGWPIVMYAHGTGGSATSAIREGVAGRLQGIEVDDETAVSFATATIDGVLHGPRRGDSDVDPETLFFNVANPRAARANVWQGAADYYFLAKVLSEVDLDAGASPTGEPITFDTDNLFFFGHSQGATVGALYVPYDPAVKGAVFSGGGGGLTLSLLNKENPINIASAVSFVLDDGEISDTHPVLSMVQQYFDPVDPLNHAPRFIRRPVEDGGAADLLFTYGLGDTYTPDPTIEVFGVASRVGLAQPTLREVSGMRGTDLPASGNRSVLGEQVTAVMVTYQPSGYDGHFVAFRNALAIEDIAEFFSTSVVDGIATVSR